MDAIERAAFITVGKACGFAWLGIFCVVFGLMYDPPMACLVGALLCLGLAVVLKICAALSLRKPYNKTEMWLYIHEDARPPGTVAQGVISRVLYDTHQWFIRQALTFAAIFLVAAIGLRFVGVNEWPSPSSPNLFPHNVLGPNTIGNKFGTTGPVSGWVARPAERPDPRP